MEDDPWKSGGALSRNRVSAIFMFTVAELEDVAELEAAAELEATVELEAAGSFGHIAGKNSVFVRF